MAKNYTNTNNSNKNTNKNTTTNSNSYSSYADEQSKNKNANKNTVQGNKNCGKIRDAYNESDRYQSAGIFCQLKQEKNMQGQSKVKLYSAFDLQ